MPYHARFNPDPPNSYAAGFAEALHLAGEDYAGPTHTVYQRGKRDGAAVRDEDNLAQEIAFLRGRIAEDRARLAALVRRTMVESVRLYDARGQIIDVAA